MSNYLWLPTPYDYTFLVAGGLLDLRSVIQLEISTYNRIDESLLHALAEQLGNTAVGRSARRKNTVFGPLWTWNRLAAPEQDKLITADSHLEYLDKRARERVLVAAAAGATWLLTFDRETATQMRITVRHECTDGIGLLRVLEVAADASYQSPLADIPAAAVTGRARLAGRGLRDIVEIAGLAAHVLLDWLRERRSAERRRLPIPNARSPRWTVARQEAVELRIDTAAESWANGDEAGVPSLGRGARYTSRFAGILVECYRALSPQLQGDVQIAIPISLCLDGVDMVSANLSTALSVCDYEHPGAPTIPQQIADAIRLRTASHCEDRKDRLRLLCASKLTASAARRIAQKTPIPAIICSNLGDQTTFAANLGRSLDCSIKSASIHTRPMIADAQNAYAELSSPTLNDWVMSCGGVTTVHVVSTLGVSQSALQEELLNACARRMILPIST